MERLWFTNKNYTSLEITKFKSISNHKVERSVVINDAKVVQSLVDRIEKIPTDGDMMISFGPDAEHIDLKFQNNDQFETIEVYQKGFKTPSTGFHSGAQEIEDELYKDIDALLFPDFNKRTLLIENLEIDFKNFSVTFKGNEFYQHPHVTFSLNKAKFLIRDKNGKEEMIEITSGQLAPQPFVAKIKGKEITILTYETKDHQRLYPDYFQII
jgi:hypothetical protein